MAVKNRTDLTNTLVANITDALNRQNTAAKVREIIQDIIDSALNSIDDAASPTTIYSTSVNIANAAILTSNGTPVLLIPSAGAGKAIVVLGSSTITSKFGTATYAANTRMDIYTDTAIDPQYIFSNVLNNTLTRTTFGSKQAATSAADTQIIANKGIYIKTDTGNPTTGDGSITVNLQYIIIDL
jgi:hypothetical protein